MDYNTKDPAYVLLPYFLMIFIFSKMPGKIRAPSQTHWLQEILDCNFMLVPLKTESGFNICTFCIIDKKRRFLNSGQEGMLKDFAAIVMHEIELRLSVTLALGQRIIKSKK